MLTQNHYESCSQLPTLSTSVVSIRKVFIFLSTSEESRLAEFQSALRAWIKLRKWKRDKGIFFITDTCRASPSTSGIPTEVYCKTTLL
jgi:hypothetical protein